MQAITLPIQAALPSSSKGGELTDAVQDDTSNIQEVFGEILAHQVGLGSKKMVRIDAETDAPLTENSKPDQLVMAVIDLPVSADKALVVAVAPAAVVNSPVLDGLDTDAAADAIDSNEVDASSVLNLPRNPGRSVDVPQRQALAEAAAAFAVEGAPDVGQDLPEIKVGNVPTQLLAPSATPVPQMVTNAILSSATPDSAHVQLSTTINQPLTNPAWGDALGNRLVWTMGQQQQAVEMRLNPPALGPLEVRISMSEGQANLTFATQHLPVREAIEAATPRLREMLGDSGINLGSVSVNVGTSAQQQQSGEFSSARASAHSQQFNGLASDFDPMVSSVVRVMHDRGMVDTFA